MSLRFSNLLPRLAVLFVCTAAVISILPNVASAQIEHYNLVLIMMDDLGKEWISCYGADDIETPHIDSLAETGIRFNNFYSMPQSIPSRLTLLTGQYPFRHGWVNHWDVPRWGGGCSFDPLRNPCFPITIRNAGYKTVVAGKWQIDDFRVEPQALKEAGFDDYCMWTGFETGNTPSSQRYQDPFVYQAGRSQTRTDGFGPDIFTDHLVNFIALNKDDPMMIYYPMVLPGGPLVATPDTPEAEGELEKHKAMVRYADKLVGRIVAAIEENGLRQNTIIVFTTASGTSRAITGSLDSREVSGGKSGTAEQGVNVPFIISCPGRVAEGVESNALLDMTDIAPTFCEIAKVEQYGEQFDGKSFMEVLDGKAEKSSRQWILAMGGGDHFRLTDKGLENRDWFRDRVMRNERYKAFFGRDRKLIKMVDLQADPKEETDVQDRESVEIQNAKKSFTNAIAEMPQRDADPNYTPLGKRQWYVKPTMKSEVWKSGYPGK